MPIHTLPRRLALLTALAVAIAACTPSGTPAVAPPPLTDAPATEAPTAEPATEAPTEAATDAPTEAPTDEPPPTDAEVSTLVPILWYGYVPPFTVDELCSLLTAEEITAIQGWTWQRTDGFANACAYDTVELHTGALVRFTNSAWTEEDFLGFYPDAMDLDGILLGDAYGRGRLDDIWIEVTGLDNLHLEIFATPLTEEQSLQLVEAVYPSP